MAVTYISVEKELRTSLAMSSFQALRSCCVVMRRVTREPVRMMSSAISQARL